MEISECTDDIALKGFHIHFLRKRQDWTSSESVNKFIQKITNKYNEAKVKAKETLQYALSDACDWKPADHLGFHSKFCYSIRVTQSNTAKWITAQTQLKDPLEQKSVHFVWFLYRPHEKTALWEVFALTTHDGWQLVRKHADYQFPILIARRLAEPKFSTSENKYLVGHKYASREDFRDGYDLKGHEWDIMGLIFQTFRSHFRANSSIYSLDAYSSAPQIEQPTKKRKFENKTSIEVGLGKVKLGGSLTPSQFEEVLNHFSLIAHQQPTFSGTLFHNHHQHRLLLSQDRIDKSKRVLACLQSSPITSLVNTEILPNGEIVITGDLSEEQHQNILTSLQQQGFNQVVFCGLSLEEDDQVWDYLSNIQRVDETLARTLDRVMVCALWKYCRGEGLIGELSFMHRFHKDFYTSDQFELKHPALMYSWDCRPSLEEVIERLKEGIGPELQSGEFATFCNHFRQIRMRFSPRKEYFPLQEFLQGELRYNKCTYFRIDSHWYQVKNHHLAVLQRNFFQLLDKALCTEDSYSQLPFPWFAKEEWVMFTPEEAAKACDCNEASISTTFKSLENQTFSILSDEGKVLVQYPVRCILENFKQNQKLTKSIVKSWENLEALFQKAYVEKKPIDISSLKRVLQKVQDPDLQLFLNALKEKRPVLRRQSHETKKKIQVIDVKGNILEPNIDKIKFKSKSIINNKKLLQSSLKKAHRDKRPFSRVDLHSILVGKPKLVETVWNELTKTISHNTQTSGQYVAQGPIPKDIVADPKTLEYLQAQHENYRLVLQEEGYNRLYLDPMYSQFIVCDQVYSSEREKVELFDIMKYDSQGGLCLYHVKEGFGQPTREACAQIRVAAVCLRNAIDSGEYDVLHKLYHQVMDTKSTSIFREELKRRFESLLVPKDSSDPSDRFVELFRVDRKKICFVYAFVDDASRRERRLEEEKNPSHRFTGEDFGHLLDGKADSLIVALKEARMLDHEARLTSHFLSSTQDSFCQEMQKSSSGKEKEIFQVLTSWASQFNSLVAKIELMNLSNFLDLQGFDFKICQIQRSARYDPPRPRPTVPVEDWNFSKNSESSPESGSLPMDLFSPMDLDSPLLSPRLSQLPAGFQNKMKTDCFFNAAMQLIFHTPLLDFFLNRDHLLNPDDPKTVRFYTFFRKLAEDQKLDSSQPIGYSRIAMREFLFPAPDDHQESEAEKTDRLDGQQDAEQAITRMLRFYQADKILLKCKIHKRVVGEGEDTEATAPPYSQLDSNLTQTSDDPVFMRLVSPPRDGGTFQEQINALFEEKQENEGVKFEVEGKLKKYPAYFKKLEIDSLSELVFFQVNRFEGNEKNNQPLSLDSHFKYYLKDQAYELNAFIVHKGLTTRSGHYQAFCLSPQGWLKFNDEVVTPCQDVSKHAEQAYILCFKRAGDAR